MNKSILVRLNGVGWNANIKENILTLNVGFSHPVFISIPNSINVITRSETLLEVSINNSNRPSNNSNRPSSVRAQTLGDFISVILKVRPWNCFSGHGIVRIDRANELVRRRGKRLI